MEKVLRKCVEQKKQHPGLEMICWFPERSTLPWFQDIFLGSGYFDLLARFQPGMSMFDEPSKKK